MSFWFNPQLDNPTLQNCHHHLTKIPFHSVYKKYNRLVLRLLQSFMCYVFGYRHGILVSSIVMTCTNSSFYFLCLCKNNFSRWFSILQIGRKTFFQIMKMLLNIKFNGHFLQLKIFSQLWQKGVEVKEQTMVQ
jgi:hypothetical protein